MPGVGRDGAAEELGGVLIVGHAEPPAGDAKSVGDADQHGVGLYLPSTKDLRHLGLGLAGQRGDASLRQADPAKHPIHRGQVMKRQGAAHLGLLPHRGVDGFLGAGDDVHRGTASATRGSIGGQAHIKLAPKTAGFSGNGGAEPV
jgi:hypothetical protein